MTSLRLLPGIHDMISALTAAVHFDGLFVSGFGFSASHYGLPDVGFIAWPDMIEFVGRLRAALPRHELLVDVDDGYGGPEIAGHVVRRLASMGATGVVLEDQARPRRFGHLAGKRLVPLSDQLEKLNAVLRARDGLAVIARTDAVEEPEIVRRVGAYIDAGVDGVLVAGISNTRLIGLTRDAIGARTLVFDQVPGGRSPWLSHAELADLGVDVVIHSTTCLLAARAAMDSALYAMKTGRRAEGIADVADCLALLDDP
ncbi:isocitrate lyase/PEP mutase family protein [Actinoallomurus sp. NPDC050550]|uniref:isocitrate lyase/PEP mutase family protein n=1 Tax=Actinoallomurus sp. NPDC050550 TaxID=3154937 RepID=UPI0033F10DF1